MTKLEIKHTPGPWKIEQHKNKQFPTCTEFEIWNQNTHVTTIHEHVDDIRIDIANASLIAAAPEMLKALELLIYRIEDGLGPDEFDTTAIESELDVIRTTIAKARGKASGITND